MRASFVLALFSIAATAVSAYDVPPALAKFYDTVKNGGCQSYYGPERKKKSKPRKNALSDGHGKKEYGYCNDTPGVVYLTGKTDLGDMDVDCDGAENCGSYSAKASKDQQAQTSFDEILSDYSKTIKNTSAISPLNAQYITYVVLGTKDLPIDTLSGGPIEPLSIVAVVCDNKLFYGVFGDTNGEDDDNYTGEASYSLANMCFPKEGLNGDNGHTGHDVLYIAFPGKEAVPGAAGAGWDAKNAQQFQETLKPLGDQLVEKAFNTETMDNWRSIKSEIPSGGVWSTGEPRTWRSILGFVGIGWILRFM